MGCNGLQQLHRSLGSINRSQDHFHAPGVDVGPRRWLDLATAQLAFAKRFDQSWPVDWPSIAAAGFRLPCHGFDGGLNWLAGDKAAIDGEGGFSDRVDIFWCPVDRQRHLPAAAIPQDLGDIDPGLAPLLIDRDSGAAALLGEAVGETSPQDRYPDTRAGHGRDSGRDSAPQVGMQWRELPRIGRVKCSDGRGFEGRSQATPGFSK